MTSKANVTKHVTIGHKNGPWRCLRGPFPLVALERVWLNTLVTDVQLDAFVTDGPTRILSSVPQRRRITARLRAEVVEHYNRGMSSRRVAATLGLGRTTVLMILKAARTKVPIDRLRPIDEWASPSFALLSVRESPPPLIKVRTRNRLPI
jgi:hypothetical protein